MGLALLGVVMMSGSLSLVSIVEAQGQVWYIVPQIVGFLIFMLAGFAETNRTPFDMPEADAELVQGFMTEYGGMRWATFFLGEYAAMLNISAITTTLFLGGWHAPWPLSLWDGSNHGWWPILWFTAKVWVFLFVFMWLRATLPRLRYDQFMALGWKILIPVSLVWIMVVAVTHTLTESGYQMWSTTLTGLIAVAAATVAIVLFRSRRARRASSLSPPIPEAGPGAFPVPPMPMKERADA